MTEHEPPKHHRPAILDRIEDRREGYENLALPLRILILLVGGTLLVGGVAMLVLPGPAFLVIPIGLAILSLEFAWAQSALEKSVVQGAKAKERAAASTRAERLTTVAFALGAAAAFAAWGYWGDVPLFPF
jgi:uncharacterized protein (TIGR02611 family)